MFLVLPVRYGIRYGVIEAGALRSPLSYFIDDESVMTENGVPPLTDMNDGLRPSAGSHVAREPRGLWRAATRLRHRAHINAALEKVRGHQFSEDPADVAVTDLKAQD